MATIREIVENTPQSLDGAADRERLITALTEREDNMADHLRLAGVQFGLYPEIVAEVLAQVGLGTAPDEATRAHIHNQFVALMNRLQQEHGHGNH